MRTPLAIAAVLATLCGLLLVTPSAQSARSAHFVAAGDFGARATTRTVLDGMAARSPSAALAMGDLAYKDIAPEAAWCDYVQQSIGPATPFPLISGNHESLDVADGFIDNYAACLPNRVPSMQGRYAREYVMDFPSTNPLVRVVMASPRLTFEDGLWQYVIGDAHYRWLSNAIDAGRAAGATWTIVATHIPCWSIGQYSCQATDLARLLVAKRVDLVLHGHEHNYQRTNQLVSGVTGCTVLPIGSYDADCVADTDGSFTAGRGTVLATVGTGGIPLRTVNAGDAEAGYFAKYSGSNANPAYGFLDIDVQEETLTGRFITTSGGPFSDTFTIRRSTGNQPPTASFAITPSQLSIAVDASTSSDPDGSITSYAWDFGDGGSGSGRTAAHVYASAGTYQVQLTVTDNTGASTSATKPVTVSAPTGTIAVDTFSRTVSGAGAGPNRAVHTR